MLKLCDVIGAPWTGRQGLTTFHFQQRGKAETSDTRGGAEPGRRRRWKVKGNGAGFPRSLDQRGSSQEKDHIGGPMETGAVPHLLPTEVSRRRTPDTNKLAQVGHDAERTHCASFVGRKPPTTARTSLLQKAQSWEMEVDLGGMLQFTQIVQTTPMWRCGLGRKRRSSS